MPPTRAWALVVLALPQVLPDPGIDQARNAILIAEDLRPVTREGLAPILAGLASPDPLTQRLAVRALGRLERPELAADIAHLLSATAASVRAEASNALGQAVSRVGAGEARRLLENRLGLESDPVVRGALLRTLGRLAVANTDERARTERLLIRATSAMGADAAAPVLEGAAHGLASLYRRPAAAGPASVEAAERLIELTAPSQPVRVRRVAMAAFAAGGRVDSGALLDGLRDQDVEVRRLATAAAGVPSELPGRERILRRALADAAPQVRYEALRVYGRHQLAKDGCIPIARALDDPDRQVQLQAIDLLGGCGPTVARMLAGITTEPMTADAWHRPAHALVSLARVAPDVAATRLADQAQSPVWWVRLYAARAAELVRSDPVLERLAEDPHPNVREAALTALQHLRGHSADRLYRLALSSDDPQLLRTASMALDSTPDRAAALPVLFSALDRVTRSRRETSRDARAALLHAIGTAADPTSAPQIRRYLSDFDPAIAEQAAELVTRLTGSAAIATPRPLPRAPVPSWDEVERMSRLTAVIVMRDGGRVRLRLHAEDAATNTARFVRLLRAGWFNGLTFHRVVPNFVVQGGSPGANEYSGDGPFTRDELGLVSNRRGTIGISTRGRDTGDGQIYVNLVDNIRLDHDYTVFAEVVEGMEVFDAMLEGAVIETILLTEGG